ncbi:MAG: 16S rRNA (cytosine(1402)-N(4))-methyltransferase RsmH [Chloroflexi bacterium]|nr:16S rRNA (cytosine(1402)-N(4))-methyltransferase RsmH [Chloroflexota bacterium]
MVHGQAVHVPVLYDEVLEVLSPRPGGRYIDCTLGGGGHALGIVERSSQDGRLLGIDADIRAVEAARDRLKDYASRVVLVNDNFVHLARIVRDNAFPPADGILFDLGLSTLQLESMERGFSFRIDAPLDMRFGVDQEETAYDLVNGLPERELADLLYRYGEESRSRAIARAILRARQPEPIRTTLQLARIIEQALPARGRIHPATRSFQALRIAVNRELDNLEAALAQAVELLGLEGVVAAISYHSLEDRLVKQFFAAEAKGCVCPPRALSCVCGRKPRLQVLTKKPITPSRQEVVRNPRSRSAKLRAARRIGP